MERRPLLLAPRLGNGSGREVFLDLTVAKLGGHHDAHGGGIHLPNSPDHSRRSGPQPMAGGASGAPSPRLGLITKM